MNNKDDFYKSIIKHSPVGYAYHKIIFDDNGEPNDYEFLEVNNSFQKIIGLKSKDLISKRIGNVYKNIKEGKASWLQFYLGILNNYKEKEFDHYFDFLDRHYRININYIDKTNLIIYFTDISREITEKEKLNLLSDNVPTQIWYLTDETTYGSANKAHADFIGCKKEDFENKNLFDVLDKDYGNRCLEENKKIFKIKKPITKEQWAINSYNQQRLLKVSKTPKFNLKGEIILVICSAEDITEQYEIEEQNKNKERILYSMMDFTQELVINEDHYHALSNGIAMLGNATRVDRVYYWENHFDEDIQKMVTSQRFEWCLGDVEQQIDNPELQNIPFDDVGDFVGILSKNKSFNTHVKNLSHEDGNTKQILEEQGILSILVLPVFVKDQFRGFIGFDSCHSEKKWSEVEISLLNSFVLLYTKSIEREFLENHVEQVKNNFDNFFNMVNDLLFVLDFDGSIIYINKTGLDRFGYSRDEILGKSVLALHPKDKIKKVKKNIEDLISKKIGYCNIPAITKDGHVFPVEISISEGIWDDREVLFAVSKDISQLSISEEKFSKAFNDSGISMFITKFESGEILEANDTFLDLIGFKREDIIGQKTIDLKVLGDYIDREDVKKEIQKNDRITNLEVNIISRNNGIKTGLCNIVPLNINNEVCLISSVIDITKRKIMMVELAEAKESSDIANRAKSEFLSHMSHEIRTPMNAVIGYSDLIANTKLDIKQKNYIDGIQTSSSMLMSIINDILDWAKIDNNRLELESLKFSIHEVIDNVVEQIRFKSVNSQVEIIVEKEVNLPLEVYGDPLRLQQVLLNLLSNAVKFTSIGEIKISVKILKYTTNKVTLEFEISDTGIGISEEKINEIFSPFKQIENNVSNKYGGTGLGLAICKRIVELMDGDIWVESKINEGSTFYFTAVFAFEDVKDNMEREIATSSDRGKRVESFKKLSGSRVLVVDDNEINRDVLKEILEQTGTNVTLSSSGFEAIELVEKENYDIVLMDLRMPGMDGYEASREIRKMKKSEDLPIIAVSASVGSDEKAKCTKCSIDDYLIKPIKQADLFRVMDKFLNDNPINIAREDSFSDFRDGIEDSLLDKELSDISLNLVGVDLDEALKNINGNVKLLIKILKKFKNNHRDVVNEIKQAILSNDIELAIRLAHTIKGISGQIAARDIHKISNIIETDLIGGNINIDNSLIELDSKLNNMFASNFFIEENQVKIEAEDIKEVDIVIVGPLLNKLELLLSESDIEASQLIEDLKAHTLQTSISNIVSQMEECGNRYDFEGAFEILKKIKSIISIGGR